MTRKEAIERIKIILEECIEDEDAVSYVTSYDADALDMAIKALKQEPCEDCISRQAAIDVLRTCYDTETVTYTNGNEYIDYDQALDLLNSLPSAQPETHEERTETHARDLISRQWLMECVNEGWIKFDTDKDENRFIHLVRDIAPSAQPERMRGTWIDYVNSHCECSVCHTEWSYFQNEVECFEFCPNCGADMREDDHETD